jgi:hypothetical protein
MPAVLVEAEGREHPIHRPSVAVRRREDHQLRTRVGIAAVELANGEVKLTNWIYRRVSSADMPAA